MEKVHCVLRGKRSIMMEVLGAVDAKKHARGGVSTSGASESHGTKASSDSFAQCHET